MLQVFTQTLVFYIFRDNKSHCVKSMRSPSIGENSMYLLVTIDQYEFNCKQWVLIPTAHQNVEESGFVLIKQCWSTPNVYSHLNMWSSRQKLSWCNLGTESELTETEPYAYTLATLFSTWLLVVFSAHKTYYRHLRRFKTLKSLWILLKNTNP